jgi:hypothetical protein
MTRDDYLRLADDGCPNCFTEWHRGCRRRPEFPVPRAAFNRFAGFGVRGPRGRTYYLSNHAIGQWLERFGQTEPELLHAVRFARVIGERPDGKSVALWYEPDGAFIIADRSWRGGQSWTVLTCMPVWLLKKPWDLELIGRYRARCGMCGDKARRAA